jgi:putative salt-induced outer membrane protein YdiY
MMSRSVCALLAALTVSNTLALGADVEDARSRVEEAKRALEAARAEYEAAMMELAAAESEESGGEVAVRSGSAGSAGASVQPSEGEEGAGGADPAAQEAIEEPGFFENWGFSVQAGITGSSGNNENFSGRVGITGERKTETMETTAFASYLYSTADGQKSAARGEAGIRNDWLLDGPWRVFAEGLYEYDEFQAWQHRVSAAGGLGYEFINNDKTTLIGRAGAGATYEMGSNADETVVPEGLLGLDLTHKLSDASTIKASTEYRPSFDDWGEFRWINKAGLEVLLDKDTNMTFNVGAEHRHDSDPGMGIKPNDVNYYLTLGWKF